VGEVQTEKYLGHIGAEITSLQHYPRLDKNPDDVRAGFRSHRVRQQIVFYVPIPNVISISGRSTHRWTRLAIYKS
jgi:plasmid stabilization system protein ParE